MSRSPAEASGIPEERIASRAGVARWFGVTPQAIDGWVSKGCPVLERATQGKPWRFDLLQVCEWRYSRVVRVEDDDFQRASDRLAFYRSERERMAVDQEKGHLLRAEDVRLAWGGALKAVAQSLDTLPDEVERDAGLDPEQAQVVEQVIERARWAMYTDLGGRHED